MWSTGMHKLKNVSISTDANLANSQYGNCQLKLGCENLRVLAKVGAGGLLDHLGNNQVSA